MKNLLLILFCCSLSTAYAQHNCTAMDFLVPSNYKASKGEPLMLEVTDVKDFRMTIFDGSGHKLYEVEINIAHAPEDVKDGRYFKTIDTGWTGDKDMNGNSIKAGRYFYAIDGECMDDKPVRRTGAVVLTKANN
ncbi:MAG: hypothetical protein GY810_14860 [Aureispira sp.]|nr:hypothetical protein [Aureispira sp.]